MTRLYLHGLSLNGPFVFSNFITGSSYSYPVLRRYDAEDGQPESPALWATAPFDRHELEVLKARMASAGVPLRPRPFG